MKYQIDPKIIEKNPSTTTIPNPSSQKNITIIDTKEKLAGYSNATGENWNTHCYYLAHPQNEKILIQQEYYKSFLIRQMTAEIVEYIGAHMALKEIYVALVRTSKVKGEAAVPISTLKIGATLDCEVYSSYVFSAKDRNKTSIWNKPKFLWINSFPDVKSAVSGKSKSFETISECGYNFSAGLNASEIKAIFGAEKALKFYIKYEKAY